MAVNRGKQFEKVVQKAFEEIEGVSIDRLHDQTTGYAGSSNICDFLVYRKPYLHYIECKSVHGNILSIHSNPKPDSKGVLHGFYGDITDKQWLGLLHKSMVEGVIAGVLCWWVDRDITRFIPIHTLEYFRSHDMKSVRYDFLHPTIVEVTGKKKRVFYDYNMRKFLWEVDK